MSQPDNHLYEFGPFSLDLSERQLFRNGKPVSLTPKDFETLVMLVMRRGHIVEKDDLLKEVWKDAFVEEANISRHVWTLRKTLGRNEQGQSYIETVPKRGYRFLANPEADNGGDQLVVERPSITHLITEEDDGEIATPQSEIAQNFAQRSLAAGSVKPQWARWRWRLACGVLGALTLGLVALYYTRTSRETNGSEANVAATAPPRSIAVLPFKTIGTEGDNEYLGLGMTDALITRLGNVGQITVRPTSAVRKYQGVEKEPVSAGQELKVESVLEGSIQRSGDRIRVTVQLVRVSDGAQVWGDKFDDQFTNVFTVQDSISEKMAEALQLKLTSEEHKRLSKRYTDNVDAYQLYVKGQYEWKKHTQEDLRKAIEYFNQAIAKDPDYALAYTGLAVSYVGLGNSYLPPNEAFPKAQAYAAKALEIDETLGEAHEAMGAVRLFYDWNWPEAEKEFKRAQVLNPNDDGAHHLYGYYLNAMGRLDQAKAEMNRAQELDPLAPMTNSDVGVDFYYARQYDEAIAQNEKTINLEPHFFVAYLWLGQAYEQKKMYAKAIETFQKGIDLAERHPQLVASLGRVCALAGERDKAQKYLAELRAMSKGRYVSPYLFAVVYEGLGDKQETFAWLEKVSQERSFFLIWLNVEPRFDNLRDDPRFQTLLRRLNLMQ
jgi:TolB-like protein/DNA-binding winged helix-turn-helix (wHTH) protein/tetratricopeptide (TPR) repeat protein